jgi:hypothetical protein
MIYIHPIGGIGNMFFQIASIWTLAKDNGDDLCLLNVQDNIDELISLRNRKQSTNYFYFLNKFLNKNENICNSISYTHKYEPLVYKSGYEYVGYFQCEKYFNHRKNEILELFNPTEEFTNEVNKYQSLFGNISLHIRRTDYVGSLVLDVVKMKYYNDAISMLPKELKILVFSDDIDWCRNNFAGERHVFIDEVDYISIYLMSKMKYHIIANSSFSWWGAWMSDYQDKIIIAPEQWFGAIYMCDYSDIVPDTWIKIPNNT